MDDQGSIAPFNDIFSPRRSVALVYGDYSGNTGSNNRFNSGNTITYNNYYGTSSPQIIAEILQSLYTSRYRSHLRRIRKPAAGTCTWVTEHPRYKDWLGNKRADLLWLSADPGCGKSVIAAFLTEHLRDCTDAIVCYFFFADGDEEQRSPTSALCAILHQLFSQRNTLCKYAEEAFKTRGKKFTEEVDTLWDILVKAVAEGECGEVICVVDGLDECDEGALAQLTRCLTSLPELQTPDIPLKFLVTGRPYHRIERELGPQATAARLKGEDKVGAINSDVTRVIDEGIKGLEEWWGRPGELGYLRELLKSYADRTFIWVSLMLDILRDNVDDSREGFTSLVSTAPRDLPELYNKILNRSADPNQARRILHIVVAAARPLTLREINVAIRIRQSHTTTGDLGDFSPRGNTVKNLCGLFVRIIDSKVYLVHQTAREFLVRGEFAGRGEWQYTLCSTESNFILADICISYLSLRDFENDPLAVDPLRTHKSVRRVAVLNYVQKYAFLHYAASHWADHFRDSQHRQTELFESTRLICKGGSGRFLTWLKVYWETNGRYYPFPNDFTHLMIASWLGQQTVVERLLKKGGEIKVRSKAYGTALNIAALRENWDLAETLAKRGVKVYLRGKEYNIFLVKQAPCATWLVHH